MLVSEREEVTKRVRVRTRGFTPEATAEGEEPREAKLPTELRC